ncbi:MAG: hypothetical protein ABTQ25_07335 [Nitrosomonas ureae]
MDTLYRRSLEGVNQEMKEIAPGHAYELRHLDSDQVQRLQFVNRNPRPVM